MISSFYPVSCLLGQHPVSDVLCVRSWSRSRLVCNTAIFHLEYCLSEHPYTMYTAVHYYCQRERCLTCSLWERVAHMYAERVQSRQGEKTNPRLPHISGHTQQSSQQTFIPQRSSPLHVLLYELARGQQWFTPCHQAIQTNRAESALSACLYYCMRS